MAATARLEAPLPAAALMRVRVLGGFEVEVAGHAVRRAAWQRSSAERLVKLLLVTPGHRLSREVAAETLWPDAEPEASRTNLRKALFFARRALGVPAALPGDGDVVRLGTGLMEVDLDRLLAAFDVLARRGPTRDSGHGATAAEALSTALELGTQTLLPDDPYEDWLAGPREQLRNRWQAVALEAAREAAASERRPDAHAILAQILERDPADEEAHRLSIDLYALEGRYHAVRRQFEQCRRALADGLDASPSAETKAAYERAELAAHAQRVAPAPTRLVGRRRELAMISPVLERAAAGRFGALVIHGPAGIGKTRLLEAVRDQARSAGWTELAWQALEATRSIAFAPFALRLGDEVTAAELEAWDEPARSGLATVVPSLSAAAHLTFADPSALRVALLAALARLARHAPRLVAIDDLGALDPASLELLGAASTVLSTVPILVAVTYRDEEPLPDQAAGLVEVLRRAGALEIRPEPLALGDVEPLVTGQLAGEVVAAPLAAELFAASEGNPLFCLELAREARDRGAIRLEQACWGLVGGETLGDAPATVRQLVATRWQALPAAAVELLRVAAELGQPEFGYETLSAALPDLRGELIAALDAALASGLLVERGAGYAFGHPLYRRAVGSRTGLARRAETHLAIARALAGLDLGEDIAPGGVAVAARRSPDPIPVAEHGLRAFELGRAEAATLAVGFGIVAAARARALLDRRAAMALFGRALDVWQRLPAGVATQFNASDAYASLGELHIAAGDDPAAESAFRSAITAARDPEELAIAYERFSWLPYEHGNYLPAIAVCEEGLARLPTDASVERAILRLWIGWLQWRLAPADPAYVPGFIALWEDVIAVLETADGSAYLSTALDFLAAAYINSEGRHEEAIKLLQRALSIALERRDAKREVLHRYHLGTGLMWLGRPAEGRPYLERAIELAEQMGEWYLESLGAWEMAEMEHRLGNLEAARDQRLHELSLLARAGGNAHHEALAHAHLARLARALGDPASELREAARARELAAGDVDAVYRAWIDAALTSNVDWTELPPV